jgi:hypothetical protein
VGPVVDHRGEVGRLVQVLSFGVPDLTDVAGGIATAHLPGERHVGVVLGEHVDAAGLLGRLDQCHALSCGPAGGRLRQHAHALLEGADGDRGMLVEVVDQDHGIQTMPQERLDIPVGRGTQPLGRLLAAPIVSVADRDHLHPGLLCQASQGGTST